ncbi:MAG: hypothetical protein AMXMBFR6_10140 [Betaproteobacteria bacterium]
MSAERRRWPAWLRFGLIALVVSAALIWVLRELLSAQAPVRKKPAQVLLLPTPAPPPPPPPKEERKPDPPKAEDKPMPVEPQPQAPPQENEPLKMEGPAGDGPSPFASGPVTRDYGGGPTGSGPSSGGRAAYALFTHAMQRSLQEQLNRDRRIKRRDYRIDVRVWLAPAGGVERVELADSTGDAELDRALVAALRAASLREPPPAGLPQPVRLRVANRGAG